MCLLPSISLPRSLSIQAVGWIKGLSWMWFTMLIWQYTIQRNNANVKTFLSPHTNACLHPKPPFPTPALPAPAAVSQLGWRAKTVTGQRMGSWPVELFKERTEDSSYKLALLPTEHEIPSAFWAKLQQNTTLGYSHLFGYELQATLRWRAES